MTGLDVEGVELRMKSAHGGTNLVPVQPGAAVTNIATAPQQTATPDLARAFSLQIEPTLNLRMI